MKFSDLASVRKQTIQPSKFGEYTVYLGFEHFDPGALRINAFGSPSTVTSAKQRFLPGDTIYGKLRPYFRKVAYVADFEGICSTDLWVFQPKLGVDPRYVFYVAASQEFTDLANSSSEGTRMPRASWSVVKDFEIRNAPIEEQRLIAATLGALDDKIESNRRQLQLLDSLLEASWQRVSADAGERRRLSDLVTTQYGLTASAEVESSGPRFLRVTDINKENWIGWSSVPSVTIDLVDREKYQLHRGDLVVARMADPGKSALYDDESIDAVFASYLVRLRTRNYAESLYIYGFLKSTLYADYTAGAMTGSVQKNMNARVIVAVDLPWPSQQSLDSFASCAAELRASINQRGHEIDRLVAVREALLPELLSGRMSVPVAQEAVA